MTLHPLCLVPLFGHLAHCQLVALATSLETHVCTSAQSMDLPNHLYQGTSHRKYPQLYMKWKWNMQEVYGYQQMMKIGWEDAW